MSRRSRFDSVADICQPHLLDQLIRLDKDGLRYLDAKRLRGPQVDGQLILGWLFDGRLGWISSFQDLIDDRDRAPPNRI